MKKYIIIGVTVVIAAFIFAFVFLLKKEEIDLESQRYLTKIIYDSSGGMDGSIYNVSLNIKEKRIVVEEKSFYDEPVTIREYKVSDEDINSLKEMIAINKFPEWAEYEMDETLFAYDAASKSVSFEYEKPDLDWYTVNVNAKLTGEQRDNLNIFIKLFLSLVKDENLIETN